jgi:hypothetical protein
MFVPTNKTIDIQLYKVFDINLIILLISYYHVIIFLLCNYIYFIFKLYNFEKGFQWFYLMVLFTFVYLDDVDIESSMLKYWLR